MINYPNKTKVSFFTLGCRLNQSETAVIERTFEADGYKIVRSDEPADIAVINTCTVTENGDTDTRRAVKKMTGLNPNVRIALIGCQAQVQKEKLAELPNVRWIVGNSKKMDLVSLFKELEASEKTHIITPTISRANFIVSTSGLDRRHTRANIKVQDGCDFFCSFCEIPYARGRARSREFTDILKEVKILAGHGHKEIIITGINVGTYQERGRTLIDVIDAIEEIPGIKRIRISSIEPTTIDTRIIDKMSFGSKLCRYLHIPVQSCNNDILKAMKRKYSFEEFSDFVNAAHAKLPGICIGTDVIVGFPGETEIHFQDTMDKLRELPIHYFHTFSYSKRHMAQSQDLDGSIKPQIIANRSRLLRELSERKKHIYYSQFLGTDQEVLFEKKKNGWYAGTTDHYVRVTARSPQDISNQFHSVRLTQITSKGVLGVLNQA